MEDFHTGATDARPEVRGTIQGAGSNKRLQEFLRSSTLQGIRAKVEWILVRQYGFGMLSKTIQERFQVLRG